MNSVLFDIEYSRGLEKYPPMLWANLETADMIRAISEETNELIAALISGDVYGPHGIVKEALHVQVVAQRIMDEMRERETR